jgi:hypothetical protein
MMLKMMWPPLSVAAPVPCNTLMLSTSVAGCRVETDTVEQVTPELAP